MSIDPREYRLVNDDTVIRDLGVTTRHTAREALGKESDGCRLEQKTSTGVWVVVPDVAGQEQDEKLHRELLGIWAVTFGDRSRLPRRFSDDFGDLYDAYHQVCVRKGWSDAGDIPEVRELARAKAGHES